MPAALGHSSDFKLVQAQARREVPSHLDIAHAVVQETNEDAHEGTSCTYTGDREELYGTKGRGTRSNAYGMYVYCTHARARVRDAMKQEVQKGFDLVYSIILGYDDDVRLDVFPT